MALNTKYRIHDCHAMGVYGAKVISAWLYSQSSYVPISKQILWMTLPPPIKLKTTGSMGSKVPNICCASASPIFQSDPFSRQAFMSYGPTLRHVHRMTPRLHCILQRVFYLNGVVPESPFPQISSGFTL